jgi:hypothetical protein
MDALDDNNGYDVSHRHGEILIRMKADVKSNSKPVMLTDDINRIDNMRYIPIRTYMISMNHEQVKH